MKTSTPPSPDSSLHTIFYAILSSPLLLKCFSQKFLLLHPSISSSRTSQPSTMIVQHVMQTRRTRRWDPRIADTMRMMTMKMMPNTCGQGVELYKRDPMQLQTQHCNWWRISISSTWPRAKGQDHEKSIFERRWEIKVLLAKQRRGKRTSTCLRHRHYRPIT